MTIQFLDNKPKEEQSVTDNLQEQKAEVIEEEGGDTPW